MPTVDAIVISHHHYDHLDYPTIHAFAHHSDAPFVVSLGVGAHLQAWGVAPQRITELDWWETHHVPGTGPRITAAPSQHFSGRVLKDRNATLWSSLVIRTDRHAVFFSGDTGLTTEYTVIRERLGPFDLVMLEIGAFHPSWGHVHLGPHNAVTAYELLGGPALLPVHWDTFCLAMHDWDEPARVERPVPWWRRPGPAQRPVAAPERPRSARTLPWPLDRQHGVKSPVVMQQAAR